MAKDEPLITNYANLPGIACVANTQPYQVYEGKQSIHAAYLRCTIAGVAATDAQIDAQITWVEVRDDEQVIIDRLTPAELRAWYNHLHTKDAAYPADTGDIPIIHMPDNYPWRGQARYFNLGRLTDDGRGISKYKITIQWAAVVTIDLCMPTLIVEENREPERLGRHLRINRKTDTFASTIEQQIDDMFRNMNPVSCLELWFNTAVGTITQFTVLRDKDTKLLNTPVTAIAREMHRAGLTAVAGRTILPFNVNNDPSSQLNISGASAIRIAPTWSVAPGAYDVIRVLEYDGHVAT